MTTNEDIYPIIKIIGVGGRGCNIVQSMAPYRPKEVELVTIHSDYSNLHNGNGITQIQFNFLGNKGENASNVIEARKKAENETGRQIVKIIEKADLVFITADLGEESGDIALSALAKAAKQIQDPLIIAVVVYTTHSDAKIRTAAANKAFSELAKHVHLLIPMYPNAMKLSEFIMDSGQDDDAKYNELFCNVIQGIYEPLTNRSMIGIDLADYKTMLFDKPNIASVGLGRSYARTDCGKLAAKIALSNPLTTNSLDKKYSSIFSSIACGSFKCFQEVIGATTEIQAKYHYTEDFIFGAPVMEKMKNGIRVLVVATGFEPERLQPPLAEKDVLTL